MDQRDLANCHSFGSSAFDKIQNSKVLVIGAGGIGCELLKNLALSGFRNIDIIDLDTIDVSNLNRQFLFQPEHVGRPKSVIAAEAARRFNPRVNITAYHANIKEPQFDKEFFSGFDVVLNGLDNVDARRHVNRKCLAADVPLIDAGSTGYLGQVMPIVKCSTACYECAPKPTQKVYPICTIRSTPDKPVHCIVWGKEFFKLVFGVSNDSMLFESVEVESNSTYMNLLDYPSNLSLPSVAEYGVRLIRAIFQTEIQRRVELGVYEKAKFTPAPLIESILLDAERNFLSFFQDSNETKSKFVRPSIRLNWEQEVWSIEDSIEELLWCFWEAVGGNEHLTQSTLSSEMIGSLVFDKDDSLSMKFVAAASNIRCRIFGIECLSFHDAKGVAGNIIPAIATTNAIVSGVSVLQAIHFLTSCSSSKNENPWRGYHTYCNRNATRKGVYLLPTPPDQPSSNCFVCQQSKILLQVNTNRFTLSQLVALVLKQNLGFNEPTIILGYSVLYEEGEDADEDLQQNLLLPLNQCPAGGIHHDTQIHISDYSQNIDAVLCIEHMEEVPDDVINGFILHGSSSIAPRSTSSSSISSSSSSSTSSSSSHSSSSTSSTQEESSTAIVDIQDDSDNEDLSCSTSSIIGVKRKLEISDQVNEVSKKSTPSQISSEHLNSSTTPKQSMEIVDDDGVICIDDDE